METNKNTFLVDHTGKKSETRLRSMILTGTGIFFLAVSLLVTSYVMIFASENISTALAYFGTTSTPSIGMIAGSVWNKTIGKKQEIEMIDRKNQAVK